ncbi:cobalamin biosynthesis protein [Arsenicicoccus dermatophilus]|uniref:cobalamin biosynthesis protein n=1 Tax=Arsenicicoccus dermatophilus TaxID=1076331 RepID=UPI001F4C8EE2|nr:cobalamin biosynthesis protein [Arsenicicoccus dermatophilus]MCH8612713.1 cobalamin biosynthesis protein [Arsenicicoccus dermatophilus]
MDELVVGVGTRAGIDPEVVWALVDDLRDGREVTAVVTSERKATEPAVLALAAYLGASLQVYADEELTGQPVAEPSERVTRLVGVPSVAEAAVLAAGAEVLARGRCPTATAVLGRRVVSLG